MTIADALERIAEQRRKCIPRPLIALRVTRAEYDSLAKAVAESGAVLVGDNPEMPLEQETFFGFPVVVTDDGFAELVPEDA